MRCALTSPRPGRTARGARAIGWLACLSLALVLPSVARASIADLPVVRPERSALSGPAYLGDRLELRIRRGARERIMATLASPEPQRLERLGVESVDRLARALGGAWFEPEFRGESPPPEDSSEPDFTAFFIVHLPDGIDLESARARFLALPEVERADPIAVLPVSAMPNDSLFGISSWYYQPSRRDIHAPEAWDLTIGDPAIVIAILDTGVLPYHPDLGGTTPGGMGQFWVNAAEAGGVAGVDDDGNGFIDDTHGWDFVSLPSSDGIPACEDWETPDNDPSDFAGHGTAVAGVAGARSDNLIGVTGTAWNARLMPLRIGWSANGARLGLVDMSFVAQALRYATRNGATVINCSFSTLDQSGLFEAAAAAVRAGVTIVSAAGNAGQFHELADRGDVIAVAAVDENDQVVSSSLTGDYVDLSAPGHDIISTFVATPGGDCIVPPDYSYRLTGTSLAAPMVSGAVALMQSRRRALGLPLLTPVEVLLRLRDTADDIAALNPTRPGFGAGRLNVYRALVDPPGSSAERIGAPTLGPAVMLPAESGRNVAVYATTDNHLLFLQDRDDTLLAVTLPARPSTGVAAAHLVAGGRIGLFVGLVSGRVAGYDETGAVLSGWPVTTSASVRLSLPALGDLDGDGAPEVVCGGSDGSIRAWHADGSVVAGFPAVLDGSPVIGGVALADLDGIAGLEVVASTNAANVHVVRGDGTLATGWPVHLERPITSPVIGRLGTRVTPTILVAAGPRLYALRPDGGNDFGVALTSPLGGAASQDPALGDLDGDGSDEIVVATRGPATLAAFDSAGARFTLRWPRALADTAQGPPVIGQLRGGSGTRARPEIALFAGGALTAFSDSAVTLVGYPRPGGAGLAPTLVELDRSGATQILAGTGPDSVLYIYDGGPGSASGDPAPWPTPRGNFARTGSRIDPPVLSVSDRIAPSAAADLAADSIGLTGVALGWTAPGDDGAIGRAAAYEVRRATHALDDARFASGDSLTGAPLPAQSGQRERMVVSPMERGITYFFALRARDDAGNVGPLSEQLVVTPGAGEPGKVLDLAAADVRDTTLTLRWSATGDDGPLGRPESYRIVVSTGPILGMVAADSSWVIVVPGSAAPGQTETHTIGGLAPGSTYYLAVVAEDDDENVSRPSNVVNVTTRVGGPLFGRTGMAIASRTQPSRIPVELYWQLGAGTVGGVQAIRIYDVAGRTVRRLPLASVAGGIAKWDGRDDEGSIVPAGLYYARLISGSFHSQARVVLLP